MKTSSRSSFAACALLAAALLLAGCGGTIAGGKSSVITGRVVNTDGLPVRGATVTCVDASTITTTNGAFVLEAVRADDLIVQAEFFVGSTRYRGQNLARTFEGEQSSNVNIMIAPSTQLASISGTVEDRNGRRLSGASVFALGAGALSSARALTDADGRFTMSGLVSGYDYIVSAGGRGYRSDEMSVNLRALENRALQFVLDNPGYPSLPAPTWVSQIAWTSHTATRGSRETNAYEQVKREFDPKRAGRASTRLSGMGYPIEVELEIEPIYSLDLLGYNVYRGFGNGNLFSIDLFREPLGGVYIDGDLNLIPNATYRYEMTALGTRYPDDPAAEGPGSTIVSVRTLGDLELGSVYPNNEFSWRGGSGATEYIVYVFDRFPGLGTTSIWNNSGQPTTQLSLFYSGPRLTPGATYYYMVLGLANGQQSRTISRVGTFTYTD